MHLSYLKENKGPLRPPPSEPLQCSVLKKRYIELKIAECRVGEPKGFPKTEAEGLRPRPVP